MAEIQIIPNRPTRPEGAVEPVAAPRTGGDHGFALLAGLMGGWQMQAPAALAAAPMPAQGPVGGASQPDPLTQWLEVQTGFSAEFTAPPVTDPALEALVAALPDPVPAPDLADAPPPITTEMPVLPAQGVSLPDRMPPDQALPDQPSEDLASATPQPVEAEIPTATPLLQAFAAPKAGADPVATAPMAAAMVLQAGAGGAPRDAGRSVAQPASVATVSQPSAPVGVAPPPAVPIQATDSPVQDRTPFVAAQPDRTPQDGTATAPATLPREAGLAARGEITLPQGMAEAMADTTWGGEPLSSVTGTRSQPAGATIVQPGAPDARPVLQQVTEALVTTRGDRTEIALSPEELGRIRLIMSGPDRTQITIWAERPETLDLVRRNADLLTQQLAEAGVNAGSLDFRQDDRAGWQAATAAQADSDDPAVMAPATLVQLAPAPLSDRRIDIRL